MDVEMAATIAWCLIGAVMVGAVLMYGCMYPLISQSYEEGRLDSLSRVPPPAPTMDQHGSPEDETPTPHPRGGGSARADAAGRRGS